MKKIKVFCDNNANIHSKYTNVIEVEDDATDEEIDEAIKEWALERYEYGRFE